MTNNSFKTSDFPLAITLSTLGFPITALDRTNPQRVKFCFNETPELAKIIQQFWTKTLRIEPQILLMHQKILKNQLFTTKSQ